MLREFEGCVRILLLCLVLFIVCSMGTPALLQVNISLPHSEEEHMEDIRSTDDVGKGKADHVSSSYDESESETEVRAGRSLDAMDNEHEPVHDPSTSVYEVVATGYYAGIESTGKSPGHPEYGITYSGVKVRRGTVSTIAADLEIFPIGTVLYIPGYGYGVVADIGGAIKGHIIDLYFPSKEDVYKQWGKRTVKVMVVQQGDGYLDEAKFQQLETIFSGRTPPPSML